MPYAIFVQFVIIFTATNGTVAMKIKNVTEFWKTCHLHTSEIIRISNFAAS